MWTSLNRSDKYRNQYWANMSGKNGDIMTKELKQEIFEYLDEMRDANRVNMYSAAIPIAIEFDILIENTFRMV